ncbi:curli assembly protein CsgF [Methylobacterium terrae]|uniref:curli assembly protein CsgF n=1 Tax=Methylobacterium terrae TaxID=2202827 RepID=UPI00315B1F74
MPGRRGSERVGGLVNCFSSVAAASGLVLSVVAAAGSPLTYQPNNPSFGGSPLNGTWLLQQGTSQNVFVRQEQQRAAMAQAIQQAQQSQTSTSQANNFAAIINARLLAAVADRITTAIFGQNAQQSGTFVVQGTTITFQQVGANVQITVNDGTSTSTVTVPLGF